MTLADALRARRVEAVRCPVGAFIRVLPADAQADYNHTLDNMTGKNRGREFAAAEVAAYWHETHDVEIDARQIQQHVARRCKCPSPTN